MASQLFDIAVSAGSACNSANAAPSYVLSALGRSDALARSAIRISLGRYTTAAEIDYTVATLSTLLNDLARQPTEQLAAH